jgi:hypothetical protein
VRARTHTHTAGVTAVPYFGIPLFDQQRFAPFDAFALFDVFLDPFVSPDTRHHKLLISNARTEVAHIVWRRPAILVN